MFRLLSTVSVNQVTKKVLAVTHTHMLIITSTDEFTMLTWLSSDYVFVTFCSLSFYFYKVHWTFSCIRLNVQLRHMTCLMRIVKA